MKSHDDLEVLNDITELLLEDHTNVRDFLKRVVETANEVVRADWGFIGIIERTEQTDWVVVWDPIQDIVGSKTNGGQNYAGRLPVGGEKLSQPERSFVGYVAHTRRIRRSGDVSSDEFYRNSNIETRAELAAPILFRGEVLAVINFESKTPRYFTAEHERLVELISKLISTALHGLMTQEGIRRHGSETKILDAIGACLRAAPVGNSWDAGDIFDDVAAIIARGLNSRLCYLWLLGPRGKLFLRGSFSEGENQEPGQWQTRFAKMAIKQRRLVKSDVGYQLGCQTLTEKSSLNNASAPTFPQVATPLLVFGEPVGAISLGRKRVSREVPRPCYTAADDQLLEIVQGQLAAFVALKRHENNRLEQFSIKSLQASKVLSRFRELNLATVLRKAVRLVPKLCNGLHCSVFLWNEKVERFVLAASSAFAADLIGVAEYAAGEGLTGWVGKHGKPLLLDSRAPSDLSKIAPDLVWCSKYSEVGSKASQVLHPFAAVPIFRDGKVYGVLRVSNRKKGFFNEPDALMMTAVASKISAAIAYSEGNEERVRLLDGLQELIAYTRTLPRDSTDLEGALAPVLKEVCKCAQKVFEPSIVTIYFVREGKIETPPAWEGNLFEESVMQSSLRPGDVPFVILSDGTPKFWADTQSEPLLTQSIFDSDGQERRKRFVEREGILSAAGIPLSVSQTTVGIMFLSYRTSQLFDDERKKLIEVFTTQAALSIEIARLYEELRKSASTEERLQLAKAMHETLNTLANGVARRINFAMQRLPNDPNNEILRELEFAEKNARNCVAELRAITGQLVSQNGPLEELIRSYVEQLAPLDLKVCLTIKGSSRLAPTLVQRNLYLIARQIFNNVLSHAEASNMLVLIDMQPQRVVLQIEDDGKGFVLATAMQKAGALGLRSIQSSVDAIKGEMRVTSEIGVGSKFIIEVPYYNQSSHQAEV